jgi:hypothetical protein
MSDKKKIRWHSILDDPTFGSEEWREMRRAQKSVMLFGQEALDELLPIFDDIVDATYDEDSFCEITGCPKDKLKQWLALDWIQHHAADVAEGKESAGPFSLLLIRQQGPSFTLDIYSRKSVEGLPKRERERIR